MLRHLLWYEIYRFSQNENILNSRVGDCSIFKIDEQLIIEKK